MNRIATGLQVASVLALVLVSWICALDATANRAEYSFLWAATAVAAVWLVLRLVRRAAVKP